jgi:hypothetical protein
LQGESKALGHRLRKPADRLYFRHSTVGDNHNLLDAALLDALDLRSAPVNCSMANLSTNQPGISV